jgi:hypothetical protein
MPDPPGTMPPPRDCNDVTRTESDGSITVLADKFNGQPLHSPNGVIVKSDDTVWFTDPSYGIARDHEGNRGEAELPRNVYRLDPRRGKMDVFAGDFSMPKGLCFSPDEKKFYVTDTGELGGAVKQTLIRVYDVGDDGKLSDEQLLLDFKDAPHADDIPFGRERQNLGGRRLVAEPRNERIRARRNAAWCDRADGGRRESLFWRPPL